MRYKILQKIIKIFKYLFSIMNQMNVYLRNFFILDQPEPPSDFKVLNITKNSITLGWRNNFDGGDMQKFRIRYRKDTMDPTYKYIETENVLLF